MMLNLPCKRSKWGGSDRKQGIHKAVLHCVHLMSIARAASLGSSKFSLGFDYFLIVSAFFLQSFNLNFEGSKKTQIMNQELSGIFVNLTNHILFFSVRFIHMKYLSF